MPLFQLEVVRVHDRLAVGVLLLHDTVLRQTGIVGLFGTPQALEHAETILLTG